jgi:hypothetical protein
MTVLLVLTIIPSEFVMPWLPMPLSLNPWKGKWSASFVRRGKKRGCHNVFSGWSKDSNQCAQKKQKLHTLASFNTYHLKWAY